ncbi:unnamed protein product [Prunus brigantina]
MPTSGMFDVFAEPSAQAFSFRFHRSPPSLPSSFHPLPLFTCFLAFFSFDSKINLYLKAVRTGNAAVGVRGTDTIVLGVKKRSTAKLQDSRVWVANFGVFGSREEIQYHHNFKAGAMNALKRFGAAIGASFI